MSEVEQIVEDILIENDIDFDHPVVPFLFEDVEQALDELSNNTLNAYATGAKYDAKNQYKGFKSRPWGSPSSHKYEKKYDQRVAGRDLAKRKIARNNMETQDSVTKFLKRTKR